MKSKFLDNNCKQFQNLIEKRLNGEISSEENMELNEHLADCPDCLDELTSFAVVESFLSETRDNPEEVPEGFFENLASRLDEVQPVRGWQWILTHPLFTTYRNVALGLTSVILVGILALSVGSGVLNHFNKSVPDLMTDGDSSARIYTNNGETIILSGDEGNSDLYSAALDDLERSYREASGQETAENSEGYIHTSWSGGESATPIR